MVFRGYIKVVGKAYPNVRYPEYSLLPILLPHDAIEVSSRPRDQMITELKHRFVSFY